ncbi:YdcF family protein [Gorillibacterium sp. sgz500922]|uniref:YdcF family protein n=1 Tax=Gorillibacterium sp. sgz500922 TaxID=3446694 RepID=UPI003F67D2D3
MKIPKYPDVPVLTVNQIEELTKIVFCSEKELKSADLIFIFGSTDPGAYHKALDAYNKGLAKEILISGGTSGFGLKHESWMEGEKPEAQAIFEKLAMNGVPEERMHIENKSRNSKENVLFAKEIYDFSQVRSLIFVSKCHAAGRQYRTLRKYIEGQLEIAPYSYESKLNNSIYINQFNWMDYPDGRSIVFGEYLRILYYGWKGDIEAVKGIIEGLENPIKNLIEG